MRSKFLELSQVLKVLFVRTLICTVFAYALLTFGFASTVIEVAKEGALTLEKSASALFPFNILYFYVGSAQLSRAVEQEPFNLDIRIIRMEAFFRFIDTNRLAQDMIIEDGEFLLLLKEKSKIDLESEKKILYMITYAYGMKRNTVKFAFYFEKLQNMKDSRTCVEDLKKRFPNMVSKNF